MRFMILGATGMAGHVVSLYLQERGHDVLGWSRTPAFFLKRHVEGDAFDLDSLHKIVEAEIPDVLINCVGLLVSDSDQHHDLAVYLNSYFPHVLAAVVSGLPTRVFHLSTDCVFSGEDGPYDERSLPNAREFYGRAKALGELIDDRNLTLRQSIVGPDIDANGTGLLNWFMKQEGAIEGWTKAIWTGLTTLELAKAIEACACDGSRGLVNMVPDEPGISKYELLTLFNRYIRGGSVTVRAAEGLGADKSLQRTELVSGYSPQSYEEQVKELAIWIRGHRSLYPHYVIGDAA